jgi:hypothetical protein
MANNNDFLILNINTILSFKQIKTVEDRFSMDIKYENYFFFSNFWEKEIEKEKIKFKSGLVENLKEIKEINKLRKRDQEIQFNFDKYIEDLEVLYKDYLHNKISRENTINKNIFINNDFLYKKNIEHDYLNLINNSKDKIQYLDLNYKANEIFIEHLNHLEFRKGHSKFLNPYYFFPRKYLEKSMPTQLKHWTSSIYNYNKKDQSLLIHLDLYVSNLLESFFNVKWISRKNPWNMGLLIKGFKTEINKVLINNVYTIFNNTSDRTNHYLRNLISIPSTYLESTWFKKQVLWLNVLNLARDINKTETGILSKKKNIWPKRSKILLSKPLFKHTSYNLIVDLFIYKSKTYKREKLKNILFIRSIYKYMLSMYTNYPLKIKETLNRPRFFYLNLIEPRISYYYRGIINTYGLVLFNLERNKLNFLILYLKRIRKFLFKGIEKENIFKDINLYDLSLNKIGKKIEKEVEKEKKKKITESKSRYLLLKNYFQELNRKSNNPLDLNLLTLWSKEGLESKEEYNEPKTRRRKSSKFNIKRYRKLLFVLGKKYRRRYIDHQDIIENNEDLENHSISSNSTPISSTSISTTTPIPSPNPNSGLSSDPDSSLNTSTPEPEPEPEEEDDISDPFVEDPNFIWEDFDLSYKNFYLMEEEDSNINENIEKEVIKEKIRGELEYNWLNEKKSGINKEKIKYEEIINKSKFLWSILDSSLLSWVLNNIDQKEDKNKIKNDSIQILEKYGLDKILNHLRNLGHQSDLWYLGYSLSFLKSEFYNINRDVLVSYKKYLIPNEYDDIKDSFSNKDIIKKIDNIKYFSNKEIPNERINSLGYKMDYSEEMFKPYYRHIIPFLILRTYKTYLRNLGLKYLRNFKEEKFLSNNIYILFNFIVVKTLLDLFNYSYRSLVRVNLSSKIYYVNKVKNYLHKFKRVTFIYWSGSLNNLRKLRKTNNYISYWYGIMAGNIFKKIELSVLEDTKRKVLLPFVFYFEDILYIIYGKWVILRIWPLRKYILSSFILTKRIMLLIQWRGLFVTNNSMYKKLRAKLIKIIKWGYLKKGYATYLDNKRRWPLLLINNFKDKKSLNYANLEHYSNKEKRNHFLSSYALNSDSFSYINNKMNKVQLSLNSINVNKDKDEEEEEDKNNKIEKEMSKEWFKLYLGILRNTDISGIKFKLVGRTQFSRSNQRSFYRSSIFGNLKSPNYSNELIKPQAPYLPVYRGHIKANVDSSFRIISSSNGTISIKVWIISFMSADIEELLLYLIRIKDLYNIINLKYYRHPLRINKNNLFILNRIKPL